MSQGEKKRPLWRLPMCWLSLCGCRPESDDTGIWGECQTCHRRFGFVSRAAMRRYTDREVARRLAKDPTP